MVTIVWQMIKCIIIIYLFIYLLIYVEYTSMSLFAEEVILSEEKTSTEDKIKIMEGGYYDIEITLH